MVISPGSMGYDIGELDSGVTERLREVKAVLDHAGTAKITENLAGVRWAKLLFNVAASGMSTALGATGGKVMESDKAADAVIYIMVEANGARLPSRK
jgi:2-dehydropantoate 2-reductase